MSDGADPRTAAAIRLRPARVADARTIARVCEPSWRERYRGIVPARVLGRETPRRLVSWARSLVAGRGNSARLAIVDGKAVGFMALRRRARCRLEVFQLFVLPAFQHRGVGRALLDHALAEAGRHGSRVELWVLRDNAKARAWYARRGGAPGRPGRLRWNGATIPMRLCQWPAAGERRARPLDSMFSFCSHRRGSLNREYGE